MEILPYSGFMLEVGSQCTWLVKVQMGNVLSFACRGISVDNVIGSLWTPESLDRGHIDRRPSLTHVPLLWLILTVKVRGSRFI